MTGRTTTQFLENILLNSKLFLSESLKSKTLRSCQHERPHSTTKNVTDVRQGRVKGVSKLGS